MNLFEIVAQSNAITQLILSTNGEDSFELENQLGAVNLELKDKIDSYFYLIERLEKEEEYFKEQATRLLRVSVQHGNLIDRLKENIKKSLILMNKREAAGNETRFLLTDSQPRVSVFNEAMLREEYFEKKIIVTPNKEKIKSDLQAGVDVPGAALEKSFALRKYLNKGDR